VITTSVLTPFSNELLKLPQNACFSASGNSTTSASAFKSATFSIGLNFWASCWADCSEFQKCTTVLPMPIRRYVGLAPSLLILSTASRIKNGSLTMTDLFPQY
jgi:hypothetical protein